MVDDGSVFLGWKTSKITFLHVRQKQGQNSFVRLEIPKCAAEHDVIIRVTWFVVCFGSVLCYQNLSLVDAAGNDMVCNLFPATDDPCADFLRVFPRAHLHTVGMLQFMSLTHTNRACPLLFILFLCLLPSLWPFQLYFLPTTLCFLTLFFRSYFCLIGPFNYISLYESLPQPWYNPLWLTGLKAPTT